MMYRKSTMLKLWAVCGLLCCVFSLAIGSGDIGPGVWQVNHIQKCEVDLHKFKFDIKQNKLNRTHDCFNADFSLQEAFDENFGVRVDICKYVDGGCKQYQVLAEDSFVGFATKYAANNVKTCLEIAGVDPPEFPIQAGEYKIADYVFDYSELPTDGIYGIFCARGFMLRGSEEVGCVEMHVEFKKAEEEDDDE